MVDGNDIGNAKQVQEDLTSEASISLENVVTAGAVDSYQGESDAKVIKRQSMYQRDPPIDTIEDQDCSQYRTDK
jgi:hypothetical protein